MDSGLDALQLFSHEVNTETVHLRSPPGKSYRYIRYTKEENAGVRFTATKKRFVYFFFFLHNLAT